MTNGLQNKNKCVEIYYTTQLLGIRINKYVGYYSLKYKCIGVVSSHTVVCYLLFWLHAQTHTSTRIARTTDNHVLRAASYQTWQRRAPNRTHAFETSHVHRTNGLCLCSTKSLHASAVMFFFSCKNQFSYVFLLRLHLQLILILRFLIGEQLTHTGVFLYIYLKKKIIHE